MLGCRFCGQCSHINTDNFIEYAFISGTETRYIDCETGDVNDYGDTDTDSSGESSYECPHCGSDRIDFESSLTAEEANSLRAIYDNNRETARKEQEAKKFASMAWDK